MSKFMRTWAFRFVWLFAFTLTWEESVAVGGVSLTKIAGMLALGWGLFAAIAAGKVRKPHTAHFAILVFLFWTVVTYFFSVRPAQTFPDVLLYIELAGLAFLVYEFVSEEKEQISVLQAFVLGSVISIGSLWLDYAHRSSGHLTADQMRYAAAGFDPNDLAVFLALSTCTALYLATVRKERAWKWFDVCVVPPTLLAIVLTGSRGGLITLLVALTIIPAIMLTRRNYKRQLLVIAAIVLLSVGVLMVVPGSTWERLATTGQELLHGTLTERKTIWHAGMDAFVSHPIVGTGAGTFGTVVAPKVGSKFVAHNMYVELLAEQGIVGLVLFGSILIVLFLSLRGAPNPGRRFWLILLFVFMVGSLSLSLEKKKILWFIFGMVAAWVSTARRPRPVMAQARVEVSPGRRHGPASSRRGRTGRFRAPGRR